ncbi:MAG TPA: hypothetical protein VK206_26625 [Anaerolineales bacterium]|nr:hypothetical protein [Anaerolineales bacterium]
MLKRLPKSQAILQVYAVIAVMFSGWTIIAFLWKLSAWLLLLNIGEIFTIFAYAMVVNLVESLIILLLLLIVCALLPSHILRDDFTVRGAILSIGLIGSLMAFVGSYTRFGLEGGVILLMGPVLILLLTAFLLGFASKFRFMRLLHSTVLWMSDRLVIFLFILLPLFVILLVYVIFRNIV